MDAFSRMHIHTIVCKCQLHLEVNWLSVFCLSFTSQNQSFLLPSTINKIFWNRPNDNAVFFSVFLHWNIYVDEWLQKGQQRTLITLHRQKDLREGMHCHLFCAKLLSGQKSFKNCWQRRQEHCEALNHTLPLADTTELFKGWLLPPDIQDCRVWLCGFIKYSAMIRPIQMKSKSNLKHYICLIRLMVGNRTANSTWSV